MEGVFNKTFKITSKNLDEIIENFAVDNYKPPVVIGHPDDDAPAMGFVTGVKRMGGRVIGTLSIIPEFAELLKREIYKYISPAIWIEGAYRLKHVAFVPSPAMKELDPNALNATERRVVFQFSEDDGGLLDAGRSSPTDKTKQENRKEEVQMPDDKVPEAKFTENQMHALVDAAVSDQTAKLRLEVKNFSEKIAQYEKEKSSWESEKAEFLNEQKKSEIISFADKLIKEGKMLPKDKDHEVEFMMSLDSEKTIKFADKETTSLKNYQAMIGKRPKLIEFNEIATRTEGGEIGVKPQDANTKAVLEFHEKHADAFFVSREALENYGGLEEFSLATPPPKKAGEK